jgi:RimJ/RimL family protein N-acetyltransferase
MILEYIEQIVKTENYSVAMISPDPENNASCRCVEKCGFRYVKTYNSSKEKEAIYIKEI